MAEVITYGVKSVAHGAVAIPNVISLAASENPEMVTGGGDDKLFPVLNRVARLSPRVVVECEDEVAIAVNTKASLVWTKKTLAGTKVFTAVNMVYAGEEAGSQSGGGRANSRRLVFEHESADGTTAWVSSA